MALIKHARFEVIEAKVAPRRGGGLIKDAHRHSFSYTPRAGYLYVRSRAISSRTNDNFDTFPAEEIEQGWQTFIGKPVFVNHKNEDHRRARGVIIDAVLHQDTAPDGTPDTWVEVLMEVDAIRFPKLAKAILAGDIERTSMGTDVAYSICSFCGNKAETPLQYCSHIPRLKGKRIRRRTASGDGTEDVLVHEICCGLRFFENSLLVEPPADPTAFFLGVDDRGVKMEPSLAKAVSRHTAIQEWDIPRGSTQVTEHKPPLRVRFKRGFTTLPGWGRNMHATTNQKLVIPSGADGQAFLTYTDPNGVARAFVEVSREYVEGDFTEHDISAQIKVDAQALEFIDAPTGGREVIPPGKTTCPMSGQKVKFQNNQFVVPCPGCGESVKQTRQGVYAKHNAGPRINEADCPASGQVPSADHTGRDCPECGMKDVVRTKSYPMADHKPLHGRMASVVASRESALMETEWYTPTGSTGSPYLITVSPWSEARFYPGKEFIAEVRYSPDGPELEMSALGRTAAEAVANVKKSLDQWAQDGYPRLGARTARYSEYESGYADGSADAADKVPSRHEGRDDDYGRGYAAGYHAHDEVVRTRRIPRDPIIDWGTIAARDVTQDGQFEPTGDAWGDISPSEPATEFQGETTVKTAMRKTALTQAEVDQIGAKFPADMQARIAPLLPYMVYGPSYNRGITEHMLTAARMGDARAEEREWWVRNAEAQYHFEQTGEWLRPIHPANDAQGEQQRMFGARTAAVIEWDAGAYARAYRDDDEPFSVDDGKCSSCGVWIGASSDGVFTPFYETAPGTYLCEDCLMDQEAHTSMRKRAEWTQGWASANTYPGLSETVALHSLTQDGGSAEILRLPTGSYIWAATGRDTEDGSGEAASLDAAKAEAEQFLHDHNQIAGQVSLFGSRRMASRSDINYVVRGTDTGWEVLAGPFGEGDESWAAVLDANPGARVMNGEWFDAMGGPVRDLRQASRKQRTRTTAGIRGNEAQYLRDEAEFKDGIYRWKSNGQVPFDDLLTAAGVPDDVRARCAEVRDRETRAFLQEYRRQRENYVASPEEEAEIRANFDDPYSVIDVITGKPVLKRPASRKVGFGEVKAPAKIDTLRNKECSVCGEEDSYDGDGRCRVCGYLPPPEPFQDPDLGVAQKADMRDGPVNADLFKAPPFQEPDDDPEVESPEDDDDSKQKIGATRPVQHRLNPRKGQKAMIEGDTMRPTLATAQRQQQIIQTQARVITAKDRQIAHLRARLSRYEKVADVENPAQPVPEGGQQAAPNSTADTLAPATTTQVTSPGGVMPAPGAAATTVPTTPGGVVPAAPAATIDVTAPTSGYQQSADTMVTNVDVNTAGETIGDNAFQEGWTAAQSRTFASLRLARLRIQAGIESGDDLTVSQKIASSRMSNDAIRSEIQTLQQVAAQRPRQAQATRVASARQEIVRGIPSLVSTASPVVTLGAPSLAVDSGEFLFD